MSDAAVKKEAPAAEADAGAKKGGKSALMGMVLGAVVLIGAGVGVGMFASSLFKPAEAKDAAHGAGAAGAHGAPAGDSHGEINLHKVVELSLGDLITNITNSDGRRFIKVTCVIWTSPEDAEAIGSGEGAPGSGRVQVRRLLQMALEEQLKRYEMADFTSRGAIATVSSDFLVVMENTLRQNLTDRPKDHRFVRKVILNNLLVQ